MEFIRARAVAKSMDVCNFVLDVHDIDGSKVTCLPVFAATLVFIPANGHNQLRLRWTRRDKFGSLSKASQKGMRRFFRISANLSRLGGCVCVCGFFSTLPAVRALSFRFLLQTEKALSP